MPHPSKWDVRYGQDDFAYGTEPNTFLKDQGKRLFSFESKNKKKALCLADGEGRNGVFLAKLGFDVTAVDNSSVGLEKAKKWAKKNGVSLTTVCEDLATYDLGKKSWDLIVSIFCHIPPEIRKPMHAQIYNALKPGGIFLLEAYTPDQLKKETGGPPSVELMMDKNLLQKELVGLSFELLQELERDVSEGWLHTGVGAVVQVIGRRP